MGRDETRMITVTGEGRTVVRPDTAVIDVGVRVSGRSAQTVLSATNEKAAELIAALGALGVADDDIATAGISIYPQFDHNARVIAGYEAANELRVTVREIDRVGEILDGAAQSAGDAVTIGGIAFSVADPEAVMAGARAAAIENARARAGEYAAAAGFTVGEVLMISEVAAGGPSPMFRKFAADAAGSMPISAGTTGLSASVTVEFALG